jgi:antitoxin (DNA-binding transcriptional repressor) of toxin-antitoxin stability system
VVEFLCGFRIKIDASKKTTNLVESFPLLMTITVHDAKTHFSRYLAAVEGGEEFVIARGKHPVARLVPLVRSVRATRPKVGEMMDEPFTIPTGAFAPFGGQVLKEFGL